MLFNIVYIGILLHVYFAAYFVQIHIYHELVLFLSRALQNSVFYGEKFK